MKRETVSMIEGLGWSKVVAHAEDLISCPNYYIS